MDRAPDERLPLTERTLARMRAWAARYRHAEHEDFGALMDVGRAMFDWLDGSGWAAHWLRGMGDRALEIAVKSDDTDATRAVLDLPWELLADQNGFLTADPTYPLVVVRSLGRSDDDEPGRPDYRDLTAVFMAASPAGLKPLDFEGEETAILAATDRLALQVAVEESGAAGMLKTRLAKEGPFEVVHVSCHGVLHNGAPQLALETLEGELELVSPADFAAVLGEDKPPLVVISACDRADSDGAPNEPFVRALVKLGVRNVLGWDGCVNDSDATRFARSFYGELARYASVPFAASVARRDLLRAHLADAQVGRHWHVARVYAGPSGAGACCGHGLAKHRLRRDAGYKEFLDKAGARVPVATAREFVGRRTQIQQVLRAFGDPDSAGVLIFGISSVGKSSLAARIASRMPRHRTVVVHERYDALAIFEQLLAAVPPTERPAWERTWRDQIAADGATLARAMEQLLKKPFDEHPILLVIDDLDQVLEPPRAGQVRTPIADAPGRPDAWRAALESVLRTFAVARTHSKLLLTSRYDFTLPDGLGGDLAHNLKRVPLRAMDGVEREKQWRAAARAAAGTKPDDEWRARQLVTRAQTAAGGNPGLQEILCRPILFGELAVTHDALDAVARWRSSGEVPEDQNAAQEFFQRVSLETYRNALSEQELEQLRAATLFSEDLPVPIPALEAAGRALGVGDPSVRLRRLIDLGLVEDWGWDVTPGAPHAALNALARTLATSPLTRAECQRLAGPVINALADAWQDDDGDFPSDARGLQAALLALAGDAPPEVVDRTAFAAGTFLFRGQYDAPAALQICRAALAKIEGQGCSARPQLLRLASLCAARLGESELRIALLEQALDITAGDPTELALIAAEYASANVARYDPERALATLSLAAAALAEAGDIHSRAITMGMIADICGRRGETDEALRIRRQEELPVYERLGDVHSVAVTMGQIADILEQRGETDEALRIRRQEQLPVYERLGDVRSRAVTMGQIADILQQRGETDEALRIRREEQLPVFDRLGDIRERAVTMGQIADILQQRGETDEALRIRREEELPVYQRLGDIRSRAVTMGQIADILQDRGETEEALRIRREEELPVYERIGDVRSRAVTIGQIADILQDRGETEEALRIRREEELPVFERIGDVRSRAVTMGKIADIVAQRGDTDEALRIHKEERLPVAQSIRDVESIAHIRLSCAQLRISRGGQNGEAELIMDELAESFALYRKLQRSDGIAIAGALLGQLLAASGAPSDAVAVLNASAAAFERLGHHEQAAQMRALASRADVDS